jgi:hypothetical protein
MRGVGRDEHPCGGEGGWGGRYTREAGVRWDTGNTKHRIANQTGEGRGDGTAPDGRQLKQVGEGVHESDDDHCHCTVSPGAREGDILCGS